MFEKLVAIEPVSLIPSAEEELHRYAKEVVLFRDVPGSDAEMVRRIGDADAVLLSYTSRMGKAVIAQCPNIRYIGMCCSLYSEESANVDIAYARTRGIKVLGIRDYGDRGVVEYVLHELTGLLHGFGMPMLRDEPVEITGLTDGQRAGVTVYHAGTAQKEGKLVTAGGRVLGITALGDNLQAALDTAYAAAREVHFDGVHYRKDIGARALAAGKCE